MIGFARFIFQGSIILGIAVCLAFFNTWGYGSILAGVGVFFLGTFISYLISGGRDIDSLPSHHTNKKDQTNNSSLILEFNQWAETSKSVMHKWINDANHPFIKKSLLVFITMSIRTLYEITHSIETAYQKNEISKKEYRALVNSLKEDRAYHSTYKIELTISQLQYYHLMKFLDEYPTLISSQKFQRETFLDEYYNAKDLSWKGNLKYNDELKDKNHTQFIKYYNDTLSVLGMTKDNGTLLSIVKKSYEQTYEDLMNELVNDTLTSKVNGIG